jgi:hypothetical protein
MAADRGATGEFARMAFCRPLSGLAIPETG